MFGFSLRRLWALLVKETIQMRRDRLTFAMMLGVPLILLILFGYAINSDPKGLPAVLLTSAPDHYARAVVNALEMTGYYRFVPQINSLAEAENAMAHGEVLFIVTIPDDFGHRVDRGDHPTLLVEADATDPAAASGAISTLSTVASTALERERRPGPDAEQQAAAAVQIIAHRRYNEEGITQYNIVPGLLGVILQMTMVMMTSMALTREIERGTMENLLAMPASPMEIMLGKVLPFLGVGAVQLAVVLLAAKYLFNVPFEGPLRLILLGVLIFVLALVLLGYFISTMARTQMQAMQLTFFFFLPSILLSGFMFPFRGMPGWAQTLSEGFPLTHFLRVIRAVMLKGAHLSEISPELGALTIFVIVFAALALLRFRNTLD